MSRQPSEEIEFSVSVVCLEQTELARWIRGALDLGASRLHVDLIDPQFGGGLGMPVEAIGDLSAAFDVEIDVHLMLTGTSLLEQIAASGRIATIAVHQSTLASVPVIGEWVQNVGCKLSVVIDPTQQIDVAAMETSHARQITVMTVEPGGAGRRFESSALRNIEAAARLRDLGVLDVVEVDGAVGPATVESMVSAGGTRFVLGSRAFPGRTTAQQTIREMKRLIALQGSSITWRDSTRSRSGVSCATSRSCPCLTTSL